LTAAVRWTLRVLFGTRLYDANVPFKVFRRSLWLEAERFIPADTLAPSLFLAVYADRRKFDIRHVDVPHRERQTGTVSIRRWKLMKFCVRAFGQLVRFRFRIA
jgi:hypothetical protein